MYNNLYNVKINIPHCKVHDIILYYYIGSTAVLHIYLLYNF